MKDVFEPIADWSPEARRRLVAERGDELRELLDKTFWEFSTTAELAPFGFRGEDPVDEAVAWCIERFSSDKGVDPGRLWSRSFELFTQVPWWLSQKVGTNAYRRIRATQQQPTSSREPADARDAFAPVAASEQAQALRDFKRAVARTLRTLCRRTCPDVVGFWLRGTERLRAHLFRWRGRGQLSGPAAASSASKASKRRADALFRFMVLHQDALAEDESVAAVEVTMLSPCENRAPYRVSDRLAATDPRVMTPTGRGVAAERKAGCAELLGRLTGWLHEPPSGVAGRLEWVLGLASVSLTTVAALGLDASPSVSGLKARIASLPRDPVAALEAVDVR